MLDSGIVDHIEWIQVKLQSASEERWVLWDHCHFLPQLLEVYLSDINAIYVYYSVVELDNSAQWDADCWFASSGSADNADFSARLDLEGEIVQHWFRIRSIPQCNTFEFNIAFSWPIICRLLSVRRICFLWHKLQIQEPLHTDKQLLNIAIAVERPNRVLLQRNNIPQQQGQQHMWNIAAIDNAEATRTAYHQHGDQVHADAVPLPAADAHRVD